jgi:hypothetical protein
MKYACMKHCRDEDYRMMINVKTAFLKLQQNNECNGFLLNFPASSGIGASTGGIAERPMGLECSIYAHCTYTLKEEDRVRRIRVAAWKHM